MCWFCPVGEPTYLVPVLAVPLGHKLLQQVPGVSSSPLLFLLLEMALRKATLPSVRLQAMHLLELIMQPHRCKEIAAAGPAWPATLTLVGALVSSRKAARNSSWTDPTSLAMAARLLQLQVQHGVQICISWQDKVSAAAAAGTAPSQPSSRSSSSTAYPALEGEAGGGSSSSSTGRNAPAAYASLEHASSSNSSSSSCGSRVRGRDLPQHQHQLGGWEEESLLSVQQHLLDSLKWALLSCMLGATDTVSEAACLAVLAARHYEHWQEVAWDIAVTAAGGAERVDGEMYKKYYELLGEFAGRYTVPRLGIQDVDRLAAWSSGLACVARLLHCFGSLRVVQWAGGAEQGFWKKLGPEDDVACDWMSTIICSIGDDQLPGGEGDSMLPAMALSLKGLGPVVLPTELRSSDGEENEAEDWSGVMAVYRGFSKLERKMAATQAAARGKQEGEGEGENEGEGEMMMQSVVHGIALQAANALSGCYASGCCNNPRCKNLSGVSEMGLVVGRKGAKKVCGGCKLACYCSRRCQREAWTMHRIFCAKYVQDTEGEAS